MERRGEVRRGAQIISGAERRGVERIRNIGIPLVLTIQGANVFPANGPGITGGGSLIVGAMQGSRGIEGRRIRRAGGS